MKVVLSMANNSTTPYFTRFANLAIGNDEIELIFLCLYPEKPLMVEEMNEKGFACYWVKFDSSKRKSSFVISVFQIYKLFKKIKPDVVHTHLFDDSVPTLLAAKLSGVKHRVISKLDAGFHFRYNKKWMIFDKFNNRNATKILTVSGENRKFVIEKENADVNKIVLVHQGIDEVEVTKYSESIQQQIIKEYNLQNKKVLLTVSRYIELKGLNYIIEAISLLDKKYDDFVFVFVGYGNQQNNLEQLVKQKGVSKRVVFTGWIDRAWLNAFYSITSVFVHAAIEEPFGYVIAEAMINKIPIVTTKTGAAYDCIIHKETGYLVEKKNSQDIVLGIEFMFSNNIQNITDLAYKKAKKLFTVEKMWEKHLNLYKTLIN